MWDLFKVAVRNVGRNKRRSMVTIFTIFIGVVVVTGTRGMLNGLQDEIRGGLTRKMHGDLQIHLAGYKDSIDSSPYKVMFPYGEALRQKIMDSGVAAEVSPRVRVIGLMNHQKSQSTIPVMIQAIDSSTELKVCPRIRDTVVQGRLLDSSREVAAVAQQDENLDEASFLDSPDSGGGTEAKPVKQTNTSGYHQVMMSPSLFRGLKASLGDEVVLLLRDKNEMQQALVARIVGTMDFGLPTAQAKFLWVDYKTLSEALALNGHVSELAIAKKPAADLYQARNKVQSAVGASLVSETYLELSGFLSDAMTIQNFVFNIIMVIVFTIVVSAIVNTSLMTVMERTREIGTMMSLGYRRRHILFLFLGESGVIGIVGGFFALVLVGLLMLFLGTKGLVLTLPGQAVSTVLYPNVSIRFLLFVLLLSLLCAIIAAFVPAYRASRMKPVDALNKS